MEAVGQLTGGIAHDFNNMLAVVVGGLELAQRLLPGKPEKAQRHLVNALDGANRAADLTRRLLTFARSEPARPEMTVVDECIASFAELIERTIGDRIALTLELQADDLACWVDRQQFENALLNLAVNARDAMNGHGSLTIRTVGDGEDRALAVQVIDTGCGMSPEVLERVFDPFYTTKPAGRGNRPRDEPRSLHSVASRAARCRFRRPKARVQASRCCFRSPNRARMPQSTRRRVIPTFPRRPSTR